MQTLHRQQTDGVTYTLKAPFDFSFLAKYGKVFAVFDEQDSGNICFGIADGERRYFVKFAGAPTQRACIGPEEVIANLRGTLPIYRDLAHPALVHLLDAEDIGGGFAMIFDWADAACLHAMYPEGRQKFLQLPMATKRQVYLDILAFHAHVARQGYVAIDFYDGSIMYDFGRQRALICDIDFYAKAPYINTKGRLWGSSRFMSPEEHRLGATIDEITNVYAMGATAFSLFGDDRDRSIEKWQLSPTLFEVAKKATSDDRNHRQQTIQQLIDEWTALPQ